MLPGVGSTAARAAPSWEAAASPMSLRRVKRMVCLRDVVADRTLTVEGDRDFVVTPSIRRAYHGVQLIIFLDPSK